MRKFQGRLIYGKSKHIGKFVYAAHKKRHRWRWGVLISILAVCLMGIAFLTNQHLSIQQTAQPSLSCAQTVYASSDTKVIVLDAGHGGDDPGTTWDNIYEKDINLAIAAKLEKLLQNAGYAVIMTRYDDTSMFLRERVQIAEYNNADIFVSIHQNALEYDTETSGIEVYCNEQANQDSTALAFAIQSALIQETGAIDQGIETLSDFYVVRRSSMPACLVETGFLTSSSERALLVNDQYQQTIANGIANGIQAYFQTAENAG